MEWVNRVRAPGRAGRRFTSGTGKQSVPVPDSQDAAPGGAPADSTIANPAEPSPRAGGGRFAGALFVDLPGYSTPVPPETALGSLPRALDVPALRLPAEIRDPAVLTGRCRTGSPRSTAGRSW